MQSSLFVIDDLCQGQFAIMPRPEGNERLGDEIEYIRSQGFDTVISLLTPQEQQEFGLEKEADCCQEKGLSFLSFPMVDDVALSDIDMVVFISKLIERQKAGHRMLFHCHSGAGRSAVVLTLLADRLGTCPDQAFDCIESSLGIPVPKTPLQKQWVHSMSIADVRS